ncbi:aspartate kinase [Tepidiforma thermophila]|uniref:Aspartokinase n=1 Tax=Tepidiforma thermophila (strain KCTC 52669 / CGMCC 1.13589 / G233) TaxID=2761530 RepID=A0A2A9HB38_TEPT2|nr:aspartate kinase [Tepidiforma thermophila]PFG73187.1 aspartate kinase [Tepidiforma thermophila]
MLVVQKYGGTSVADAERIRHVAGRIIRRVRQGDQVVAVVSAMGSATDDLIDLALQVAPDPDPRELDMLLSTGEQVSVALLAMALKALGQEAVGLTGQQAGIIAQGRHYQGRISRVEADRVRAELAAGRVPVVAGYWGVNEQQEIFTLGRGASDTTAVALAIALGADLCENCKDVEGIYTADPRIVPTARKLKDIAYEEMLEMATQGAQVMHNRAVELASVYNVPILVTSSMVEAPGTLIRGETELEERNRVRGIAHDLDVAKITVRRVPDRPGIAANIFEPLAEAGISVDTIVQNASEDNLTDLSFTVSRADLRRAEQLMPEICARVGAPEWSSNANLGKVSIVGVGIQTAPGYAARMFRALYDAGINIELISTSEIRLTCIIAADRVHDAVRALHDAFELERPDADV